MQVIRLPSEPYPSETVTALGFFDGVHIAHAALLSHTVSVAREKGLISAVFTFLDAPHKEGARLLSSEDRLARMESLGIEVVFVADFASLCSLSPEAFVSEVLCGMCSARMAICGFNFRFGKEARGDGALLSRLLPESIILPPILKDGETVSATRIKALLTEGRVEEAAHLLGSPYTVRAEVLHGKALGRTLGFPTANMRPAELLPQNGVYETRVYLDGACYIGLTDVGTRPSAEAEGERRMETYLPHFSGDLYGKELAVAFLRRIRGERHFASIDALKAQLLKDLNEIKI